MIHDYTHHHWPFSALHRVLTGIRAANNINMSTDHHLQTVSRLEIKLFIKASKIVKLLTTVIQYKWVRLQTQEWIGVNLGGGLLV